MSWQLDSGLGALKGLLYVLGEGHKISGLTCKKWKSYPSGWFTSAHSPLCSSSLPSQKGPKWFLKETMSRSNKTDNVPMATEPVHEKEFGLYASTPRPFPLPHRFSSCPGHLLAEEGLSTERQKRLRIKIRGHLVALSTPAETPN